MSCHINSPSPIAELLTELRHIPHGEAERMLTRAHLEAELRLVWAEVHDAAGSEARARALRLEQLALMLEIEDAVERQLGRTLQLAASEV